MLLLPFRYSTMRQALLLCIALLFAVPSFAADDLFEEGMGKLHSSKLSQVTKGIALLTDSGDERVAEVYKALLESQLYRHKKEKKLVLLLEKRGSKVLIKDLFSDAEAYEVGKRKIKRVPVNNQLRGDLKAYLASVNLNHHATDVRFSAVQSLLSDLDPALMTQIKKRLLVEESGRVRELLETAVALEQLQNGEQHAQLQAIKQLAGSLEPEVRNRLTQIKNNDEAPVLQKAAHKSLLQIEDKIAFYSFLETLFFGLSLGSVLVLAAIGLAITFGVMGCINMAHGELIMIGAYTTYVIQLLMPNSIGASLVVAIPAAFLVSGLVGILIERGVIQFLKGRPLETLLATFGVSLILQQLVRSIFSPLNRSVETPEWMSGSIDINPIFSLTINRVTIIVFCLVVFFALFMVLKKTVLGLQVRAVSQNRDMARAMGVRSEWVDALTFGLGSGIAGVAGVALSQLTNVGPNMGQAYIIDSFMVVVFGGVGNLWGTLVAGMSLGVANKILEPVSGAVLAKILVLVFIILFIQKKPRGLFPQKGRAAEG